MFYLSLVFLLCLYLIRFLVVRKHKLSVLPSAALVGLAMYTVALSTTLTTGAAAPGA